MSQFQIEDDRCYAEISLANLTHNIQVVKQYLEPGSRICAVVKANAYGHGAVPIARHCQQQGIKHFAVACLSEAASLRAAGIRDAILILGPTCPEKVGKLVELQAAQTISSYAEAAALSQAWQKLAEPKLPLTLHVKLDTGLSRHGFAVNRPEERTAAVQAVRQLQTLPGLQLEGVFTHFATAASQDPTFLDLQAERFRLALAAFREANIVIPLIHSANSAVIARHPELDYNLVRPGIMLYGSRDGDCFLQQAGLKPVMTLKARISAIRHLHKNDRVSYGGTFVAPVDMPIAIIECGYADGLLHSLSDRAIFSCKGQAIRQIGRICMDRCMLDMRGIKNVDVGDYVTLFGGSGEDYIDPEIQAERAGTISYELFSLITPRVPRIYTTAAQV